MLKTASKLTIFAIAFCDICREYAVLTNERTSWIDAERKISKHAETKHKYIKDSMGWTKVEREMAIIRRQPGFKEGYL